MSKMQVEPPDTRTLVVEDDEPLDGQKTEKQHKLLTSPLYSSWTPPAGQTFGALANVGLFFADKRDPLVPDVMLSLNIPPGSVDDPDFKSYFVWIMGKVPDVVIEIVSPTTNDEDGRKLRQYRKRGIPNYVIYDPEHCLGKKVLRAFRLVDGRYVANRELKFPELGLGLRLWDGVFEAKEATWLRWCDLTGTVIATGDENTGRALQVAEDERRQKLDAQKQARDFQKKADDDRRLREDAEKKLRLLMEKFGVSDGEL